MRQEDWNEEWEDHSQEELEDPDDICVRCGLPMSPTLHDLCPECEAELREGGDE